MSKLSVTQFAGEKPRYEHRRLPENTASFAVDCRVDRGRLELGKGLVNVVGTVRNNAKSLYLYEDTHWFSWGDFTHAVKSPVAQDDYRRVYYTNDTGAWVTSNVLATGGSPKPYASYKLGVARPSAPTVNSVTQPEEYDIEDFSDDETRFYVVTFVTAYGEEGPPSEASNAAELKTADDVVVLSLPNLLNNNQNINRVRIYRTATGAESTDFLFVGEVSLGTATFTDNIPTVSLGSALDTYDYVEPPTGMKGLVMLPNGIAAGFVGNELCFSPPYLPYAYPTSYRRSTEHDIVALAATRSGVVVATKGYPYVFRGISPDGMTEEKYNVMQSCVSSRSMVDMGDYAIYASPDGLVAIGDGGAELITKDVVSREGWQGLQPETIHAYRFEGLYIFFYANVGGFIFDPETKSVFRLPFHAQAGYNDLATDTLYLVVSGVLYAWEEQADSYTWRSKIFETNETGFSCAKIVTPEPSDVAFKLWGDGDLYVDMPALTSQVFRLPPNRGREWQFELSGKGQVTSVEIAQDMSEL